MRCKPNRLLIFLRIEWQVTSMKLADKTLQAIAP